MMVMNSITYEMGCIYNNNIYIKREDLLPFSFGGNKARKAKYFFSEFIANKYDCIVTYGSSSSNHCRIIANIAASKGINCYIVTPIEASTPTFNSELMQLFRAKVIAVPVEDVHSAIDGALSKLEKSGRKPYFIPGGGHGNLGTKAFVDCYQEILEYENENNVFFDLIFFASGTGTTQAGLICGQILNSDIRKIIGISIARKNPRGRDIVIESVKSYLQSNCVEIPEEIINQNTIFIDDYTESGYAINTSEISRTIYEVLIKYGIPLDPTYTGKAFNGMKNYINENKLVNNNILFIHTGGTPLAFDFLRKGNEI